MTEIMETDKYILATIIISALYLWRLLSQERFRLVIPSVVACFTWLVSSSIMYCEIHGWILGQMLPLHKYAEVAPFIFGMNLCSIITFSIVHVFVCRKDPSICIENGSTMDMCDEFLTHFRWILWICVIVGLLLVIFFLSLGLNINSFSEYRIMAITVEKVGYAALAKRIGGHIGILGAFYLNILGYKHSQGNIDLKELLKCILMYSSVNLAIGGRVWIIASTLPYITGYFLGYSYAKYLTNEYTKRNLKLLGIGLLIGITFFSVMGIMRSDNEYKGNYFEKFLYYTDGPKMANLVMKTFPDGTYPLEYGQANFMQFIKTSDMTEKFNNSIKDNIGLSVTVRSTIPALYYDYGFWGGIIMWGVLCGILELLCLNLQMKGTFFSIILFCTLAVIPFQSPVGSVFVLAMPSFEWIVLMWLTRKYIFSKFEPDTIPYRI